MSNQVGTREQQSDPPRTEYGYLALGVAALTAAVVFCTVDQLTAYDFSRGVYSILTGLFVVGGVGWIVRSGDTKRRKEVAAAGKRLRSGQFEVFDQLAELTSAVEQLRESRQLQRTVPVAACRGGGNMYVSSSGAQGDTVPLMPMVDRAGAVERETEIEDAFELGYRAREAEEKTIRLPAQKRIDSRVTHDLGAGR